MRDIAPLGGTRWWVGRENAALTEPALSHENCLKNAATPTGRVHAVLARHLVFRCIKGQAGNLCMNIIL